MNRAFSLGLAFLTCSWLVAVGCGDDDDAPGDNGGRGGSSGSSGSSGKGGSTPNGGMPGTAGDSSAGADTGGTAGAGEAGGGAGGAPGGSVECRVIGRLCHDADTGPGSARDCHELGHVGDPAVCVESFATCIGLCLAEPSGEGGAGGGGPGHGGATGEGGAGGPGPSPYCLALGELCHAVDDVDGPLHECHEVGHVGNGAVCEERFDECGTLCLEAADAVGGGGAGGTQG